MNLKGLYYRTRNWMRSTWWVISDRCQYCGGSIWYWDSKKSFCDKCKKQQ